MKKEYFVTASVDVCGNIQPAKNSNIWLQSVLRGDSNTITIGRGSNIRDGTIIHVDKDIPTIAGKYITVGHQCMLHGCKIGDSALIGMGSTILNNAITGESNLIGAGPLVTEGKIIPPNILVFGRPAKAICPLTATEIANNHTNALHYVQRAKEFRQQKYPELT